MGHALRGRMDKKIVSEKTRVLRVVCLMIFMITGKTLTDYHFHQLTLRHWLLNDLSPIAIGGITVLIFMYWARRLKQKVLKPPLGLQP